MTQICSGALLLAATAHVIVGTEHAGSNFGALAVAAGMGQFVLAGCLLVNPSTAAIQATVVTNLVLIQLYVVNITIGLPPVIAHSHIGGTHEVFGLTLGWPGVADAQGIIAKCSEATSALLALLLLRKT